MESDNLNDDVLLAILVHHRDPILNRFIFAAIKKCSFRCLRKSELAISRHCQAAKEVKLFWVGNGSASYLNHLCFYSISDCYFCATLKKVSLPIPPPIIVLNTNEICVVFVDRVIEKSHSLSSIISSICVISILTDHRAAILVLIICPAGDLVRVPHADHVDV